MTDLNKEREAFERFYAKECNCSYEDLKRQLDRQEALTGHRYLPTSPRHEAWLIWDAAWNDASAQTVPDGYVLVPKEIPDSVVSYLENSGFHWGDGTRDHYTPIYSLMVEVASESGAEG